MSEQPTYTIKETPVLDPNLFLLNRANRAFIERRNDTPHFLGSTSISEPKKSSILRFPILLLALFVCTISSSSSGLWLVVIAILVVIFVILDAGERTEHPTDNDRDLAGWILPGEVLHSEKIRVVAHETWHEQVGVRFQYTTPDGVLTVGYAEGESDRASDNMAPAPSTPVRVWYGDDGEIFLL